MDCDICFEKFDQSLNRPMTLIRCCHTICLSCLKNLKEKKCPSCDFTIEDSQTNWSIFKQVAESDYDKTKSNIIKRINELNSYDKQIIEMKREKKEQNNTLMKSIKMQIENESNEKIKIICKESRQSFKRMASRLTEIESNLKELAQLESENKENYHKSVLKVKIVDTETNGKQINKYLKKPDLIKFLRIKENELTERNIKQINYFKKQLFNEIETNGKNSNMKLEQIAFHSFNIKQDEQIKIENNDYSKQELLNLNQNLGNQISQLKSKLEKLTVFNEKWVFIYLY
jgi:hypothetical protein